MEKISDVFATAVRPQAQPEFLACPHASSLGPLVSNSHPLFQWHHWRPQVVRQSARGGSNTHLSTETRVLGWRFLAASNAPLSELRLLPSVAAFSKGCAPGLEALHARKATSTGQVVDHSYARTNLHDVSLRLCWVGLFPARFDREACDIAKDLAYTAWHLRHLINFINSFYSKAILGMQTPFYILLFFNRPCYPCCGLGGFEICLFPVSWTWHLDLFRMQSSKIQSTSCKPCIVDILVRHTAKWGKTMEQAENGSSKIFHWCPGYRAIECDK